MEETESTDGFKWKECLGNATCALERILNKFARDTEVHISQITPYFPETATKMRRSSVLDWLLHACCQVATTDDTNQLFHTQGLLKQQVERIKLAVHDEYRDLAQIVTDAQEMTRQFNVINNQAKHALAETLTQTQSLEERERQLVKNLIRIYSNIDHLTHQTKLAVATSVCQSKFNCNPSNYQNRPDQPAKLHSIIQLDTSDPHHQPGAILHHPHREMYHIKSKSSGAGESPTHPYQQHPEVVHCKSRTLRGQQSNLHQDNSRP